MHTHMQSGRLLIELIINEQVIYSRNLLQKGEAIVSLEDSATHIYFEPKDTVSEFFIFAVKTAFSKVKMSQFIAGSLFNDIMLQT